MIIKGNDFIAFDENGEVEHPINVDDFETIRHEEPRPSSPKSSVDNNEKMADEQAGEKKPDYRKPSGKKPKNDSPYVTKKFLVICLVIAIIVSSIFGAALASVYMSHNQNRTHSNLSESSLDKATGSKLTVAEIVAKNEDAVVEIVVSSASTGMFGQQQLTQGAGSGVIVNPNGYIVTNYHVIEGASSVKVTLHNGKSYSASIVGGDDANDMAVLKINAKDLQVATLGDSSSVAVGDLAVAIGNPLGQLGGTATTGIISALDRRLTIDGRTLTLMQTDAAINPGNSGGGLFNGAGELIGIVDAKTSATGVEGLAFAIPINTLKDEIDSLISNGKVSSKPSIGITIYDVSEDTAKYYNLDGAGVYIAEVTGDNAQKAGFQENDRIISINKKTVTSSSDLISRVRENKIGDTVTVVVSRGGQEISIKTVLEESVTNK